MNRYLEGYFRRLVDRTNGQVMAVNGYVQLYHTALRLGAKNVMAEIGNQVPLTALQIACVRGAARQYGKPFGVYYEPWGGKPFGCPCALGWSPWFPDKQSPDNRLMAQREQVPFVAQRLLLGLAGEFLEAAPHRGQVQFPQVIDQGGFLVAWWFHQATSRSVTSSS